MFLPSRVVIIDDNLTHIDGLLNALRSHQIDAHAVHFKEETGVDGLNFPGMRVLFIDLHLVTGAGVGAGGNNDFAVLASILDQIVDVDSGPYILILWTQHPDQFEGLNAYLDQLQDNSLDVRKKPVATFSLRKGDYINVVSGDVLPDSNLPNDVMERMTANPQMKALFSWEADVSAAMDATLRSIIDLVPGDQRTTEDFGPALGKVLFRLSQAGAGKDRAFEDPRSSVNRVLVPVLADRISEHDPEGASSEYWNEALVEDPARSAPVAVQAAINSAIHVSSATSVHSKPIRPVDLGAVVDLPFEPTDENLIASFGINSELIRSNKLFGVENDAEWENCRLVLVQVGASCDHAQPNDGPLMYLLGIEWPFTEGAGDHNLRENKSIKKKLLECRTPTLLVGDPPRPGKISVFLNLGMAATREEAEGWHARYRFRDELISYITQEYARHISRPGIVSL
ncbi:hypothetical protein [Oricola indica]|jgi:hypothetical protein|uniref:hypothetical protein n=1 Tax=Oricola indica TaxID=2872591 RepID=UPI001CBF9F74|nr:hypothetical protein [Oricola indica]